MQFYASPNKIKKFKFHSCTQKVKLKATYNKPCACLSCLFFLFDCSLKHEIQSIDFFHNKLISSDNKQNKNKNLYISSTLFTDMQSIFFPHTHQNISETGVKCMNIKSFFRLLPWLMLCNVHIKIYVHVHPHRENLLKNTIS